MNTRLFPILSFLLLLDWARNAQAHADLLAFINRLTEQLTTNQNNVEVLIERADLYRLHGNWKEAQNDYNAARKLAPESDSLLLGQAQLHVDMGEDSAARAVYDAILSRNPTNTAALFGRAPVLARLGERKAAIADYSHGLTLSETPQPGQFLDRAKLQAVEFGADEAIKGLDVGLARLGWMVTLQKAAIDLELQHKRTDQALARLETILSRSNRKETWLAWKGEILLAAGETRAAREVFATALKAIESLPPRMRTSPGMTELRAKVEGLLTPLSSSAVPDKEFAADASEFGKN